MSKSRVEKNKELYDSLDTNDVNQHGLDLNSFEIEDLSDIADPTKDAKKEPVEVVDDEKVEVVEEKNTEEETTFELDDLSDLEEEFRKIDGKEVSEPVEETPVVEEVKVEEVKEEPKAEVKTLEAKDEYVVDQPISYNDMLRAEEALRAKLEKQKELKDSKRGVKKSPVTDTYTAEMMQKNINQYEGVDIRKELNIKVKRAGNTRAIVALVVLLIMIIAVGVALSIVILRS